MKPKAVSEYEEGLLEYLEDIIGTASYAEQIEQCGKSVDEANSIYSEKLLKTRHSEKELEGMEEEKNIAESFLKLENSIAEKKMELFQVLRCQLEKQHTGFRDALQTTCKKLEAEQEKNVQQIASVTSLEADLRERENKCLAIERECSELMKRMKRLENEDIAIREKKSHLKKKMTAQEKSTTEQERKRGQAERELSNLKFEQERLEKQVKELVHAITESEDELARVSHSLKGKTGGLQNELTRLQGEILPFKERLRFAQAELEAANLALLDGSSRKQHYEEERQRVLTNIEIFERDVSDAAEGKHGLSAQQRDLQKQCVKAREQRQMAEAKLDQVQKDIALLQSTISEARESLGAAKTSSSGSSAIAALMRNAKTIGGGIYGRLGDLGVVDPKYDVAVSTASHQLHFVVVDTTETGQRCVEFLRKNNLGRASFIILEKMRHVPSNTGSSSGINGTSRLFDLVSPRDKTFASAFYFAFGETLIADNLETATAAAYNGAKRHRVVTLDGKLIDTSGTMSGGGKQVQRGAMRLKRSGQETGDHVEDVKISEEQLAELEALLQQKLEEQRILKAMIVEFCQNLQNTSRELKQIEVEGVKFDQVLSCLPAQIADLKSQLDEVEKAIVASRSDKDRNPELEKRARKAETLVGRAENEMSSLAKKIEEIEDKIMEAGGVKYKVQKAKSDGLKEQLQLAEARLSKVSAEVIVLEGSAPSKGKDERTTSDANDEKELQSLDGLLNGITCQAAEVKSKIDTLSEDVQEQREAISELKKTLDQHNKSLARFRKTEFELKMKKEELERELSETQEEIQQYNQAVSYLRLNEYSTQKYVPLLSLRRCRELPVYDEEELNKYNKRDVEQLQQQVGQLEARLANLPNPNVAILKEYHRQRAIFEELDLELKTAEEHRATMRSQFETLRKARFDQFMSGLRCLSNHLKQLYQMLTLGGNAELELVDSLDPFSEGIQFSVMPPKKSWKAISNLSGGEKTLASLALIFALHAFRPTPVYIMDEIDAALDYRNVSIVANYVKGRTVRAQFIVVSLRSDMFEMADRLVGVYKVNQRTRTVSLDPQSICL